MMPVVVDAEFVPYLEAYETEKGSKSRPVSIVFGDTGEMVGLCYSYNTGDRRIVVNRDYWTRVSDEFRTTLIFHELGHCDLGQDHRDDKRESGAFSSIMNPTNFPVYVDEYDYYFDELFSFGVSKLETVQDKIYHD